MDICRESQIFAGRTRRIFLQHGLLMQTLCRSKNSFSFCWNGYASGNLNFCQKYLEQDVPKSQKVIGVKGECPFQTVSGDKGQTSTVVTYISAGGKVVPPMVLFKAARVKDQWHEAAPSGYMVKATESGYINAYVFTDYGKHFVTFLKERNLWRPDKKHLVLLDLHKSHLFNVKYMQWMKENNLEVCCFPPTLYTHPSAP